MARPAKPKKSAASESLLTGRVTRSHGRHHFVQGPDGALYEAHRRGRKGDVVVGDMVLLRTFWRRCGDRGSASPHEPPLPE